MSIQSCNNPGTCPKHRNRTQRWVKVCSDCWHEAQPDQYFPEATSYDECGVCGHTAFVVSAHPSDFPTAHATKEAATLESKVNIDLKIEHNRDLKVTTSDIAKFAAAGVARDLGLSVSDGLVTGRVIAGVIAQAPDAILTALKGVASIGASAFVDSVDGRAYVFANLLNGKGWAVIPTGTSLEAIGHIGRAALGWHSGLTVYPLVGAPVSVKRGDEAVRLLVEKAKAMRVLGDSLTVSITQADLDAAVANEKNNGGARATNCVYAQALKRITGREWHVSTTHAYPTEQADKVYDLPQFAKDQIRDFDNGRYSDVVVGSGSEVLLKLAPTIYSDVVVDF